MYRTPRPREDRDDSGIPPHLASADESALAALGKVRESGVADGDAELVGAKQEIEELKAALVTVTLRLTQSTAEAPHAPE